MGETKVSTRQIKEPLLVTAGFAVLTSILTYPGLFNLSTHFMCDGGDGFQNVWNLWWFKTSLLDLGSHPYHTTYLFYPEGVSLLFHTLNPFNGLISIPLQLLFPMEVTYNLVVLFSFMMSGISMYYLARYLTVHRPAAFVAGCVYTFSPYHFAHGLGHLNLIAMEWLPLYVLFMIKTHREGGWKNGVQGGIFLILTSLCSWYYLIFGGFITLIYLIYQLVFDPRTVLKRSFGRDFLLLVLTFLIILSPLLGPMLFAKVTQDFEGAHNPELWSADLASFFVPSAISTYGRSLFSSIWSQWMGNKAENANYIGYVVLGLSILALVKLREARFWGIVGLFAFILALGPYLRVLGQQYRSVPLPYLLLDRYLPFFSFLGMPGRFDAMLVFSLALLSGYGVRWICNRLENPQHRIGFIYVVLILVSLEYLSAPFVLTQVDVSDFYREMAKDKETYGVIDIPAGAKALYLGTIHEKPLVGGYISRPPKEAIRFLEETPIIKDLMGKGKTESEDLAKTAREIFSQYGIRYIIVRGDTLREFPAEELGLKVHYKDRLVRVHVAGDP